MHFSGLTVSALVDKQHNGQIVGIPWKNIGMAEFRDCDVVTGVCIRLGTTDNSIRNCRYIPTFMKSIKSDNLNVCECLKTWTRFKLK